MKRSRKLTNTHAASISLIRVGDAVIGIGLLENRNGNRVVCLAEALNLNQYET